MLASKTPAKAKRTLADNNQRQLWSRRFPASKTPMRDEINRSTLEKLLAYNLNMTKGLTCLPTCPLGKVVAEQAMWLLNTRAT